MKMDRAEVVEVTLIAATALGCWKFAALLPAQLSIGNILLNLSALLLLQGLVRDLWLLAAAKRQQAAKAKTQLQAIYAACAWNLPLVLLV